MLWGLRPGACGVGWTLLDRREREHALSRRVVAVVGRCWPLLAVIRRGSKRGSCPPH